MTIQQLASPTPPAHRWRSASVPPRSASHPIFLLRPPYGPRDLRAALPDLKAAAEIPGTVVGVQVHRPEVDLGALEAVVRDLAQHIPSCPVVVILQVPPEEGLLVATRLAPLPLRAVVPRGPLMLPILRDALTDSAALPHRVVAWLRLRTVRLNPNLVELLEQLFTDAPEHADLTSLLDAHRVPQATARFRLRKKSLPPPSQWFQLARALHAALRLQAEPDASMTAVAQKLGFADHSALAHLLRRSLGVRASEVRGTLGWEWLLHRWFTSKRVLIR